MKRLLLSVAVLSLLGVAFAQDAAASFDPSALAGSFAVLGATVLVITQFFKQHLLRTLKPDASKWASIALSLGIAQAAAFLLQFLLGGITDPLFAVVTILWLRAVLFGLCAGLFASGFHGLATGIAKSAGKAAAVAVAARAGKKDEVVAGIVAILLQSALWSKAEGLQQKIGLTVGYSGGATKEGLAVEEVNLAHELGKAATQLARERELSPQQQDALIQNLRQRYTSLGLKTEIPFTRF